MTQIMIEPIGIVRNARRTLEDDHWGGVVSTIELRESFGPEALDGIEAFSHAEVLFFLHLVSLEKIEFGARHPRNNPTWPKVGILAQRGKNRPNRLGSTVVSILERKGTALIVAGLDAVDGTPVLDIKPLLKAFLPRGAVREPAWAGELMRDYWQMG